MSDVVFIGKQVLNLQSSPSYPPITKIVLIVSEELVYEAGDDSGMALEVQCPWGTQAIANDLLNSLGGYQYTPVQVEAALEPDPLWELGDPIRVNDISSQAVSMPTRFGKDYSIDIEAPTDQDIDHEYPYRSSSTRAIERTVAQASSELWVTMTSIGARVTNTEGAISELIVSIEGIEAHVEDVEEAAVNTVEVQYALGDSSTTPPTTGWSPVAPAWEADKFMWQKTITTYIDGTDVESDPTCIQGAKGQDGTGGLNAATIMLYKRATSAPTKPTGALVYTFATGALTGSLDGWLRQVPTTDGTPCYVIQASAVSAEAADTIAASEWSTPTVLVEDGANGANGSSTALVYLYKRSTTAATIDWTDALIYDFVNKRLQTAPTGWSRNIPAGSEPLYVTAATAYSSTSTDAIPYNEWSAPVVLVEDGVGISSIVPEYYLSTSSLQPIGGSWVRAAPAWESGKYIWTRSYITWDDSTTSTTTPQLDNAINDLGVKYVDVKINADKVEWLIASGTSSTDFTLTSRAVSLVTGTLTLEASGSDYTGSLSVSTLSGASYGFALTSDGYYTSQNARVSSTYAVCKVTVNATEACTLTLDCINYAESTYDYGVIGKLDTVLSTSGDDSSTLIFKSFSGQSSESVVKVEIPIPAGTHFFCVKYRKDASVDQGNDAFKFRKGSPAGDSATLTLKSGSTTLSSATITFRGFVTFTDLAESGATTINGNNITTGTISADRVRVGTVWYYDGTNYYSVLSAEVFGQATTTHIGAKDIDNGFSHQAVIYGTSIYLCQPGYTPYTDANGVQINLVSRTVVPATDDAWRIGTSSNMLYSVYARRFYFRNGAYLYSTSAGARLKFVEADGTEHYIV